MNKEIEQVQSEIRQAQILASEKAVILGLAKKGLADTDSPHITRFLYKNWKGEVDTRTVIPIELFEGETEYHKGKQLLLRAMDIDKKDERVFAVADIIQQTGLLWSAVELLLEAKAQINYLNEKFPETGTSNAVLTKINNFLSNFNSV